MNFLSTILNLFVAVAITTIVVLYIHDDMFVDLHSFQKLALEVERMTESYPTEQVTDVTGGRPRAYAM